MSQNFRQIFPRPGVLIGVIHLPPLPGSPDAALDMADICARASREAHLLGEAGFDGVVVENFGDVPFFPGKVPAVTVAAMTRVASVVADTLAKLPHPPALGLNVLRNDGDAALAIASVVGAQFIRVNVLTGAMITDQGVVEGRAWELMRTRRQLAPHVAVLADVMVKHARPLGDWEVGPLAEDTWYRAGADGLIVTGEGTGKPASETRLLAVRSAVPQAPLLVGSGTTLETVAHLLAVADGVIIGTALKFEGRVENTHDPARIEAFVQARNGCHPGVRS